ncbi:tRNA (adenosine(37)-N6)-threonylcarbamoyltransferase complex dimerization subunit type 1 TsaB [Paenibacillus sp. GCM10023248]|uniref:tRNA (adenosine(37)-N6)-threonylcarbamoyltransferase complex dimerization subunit type 1 TsaB n=1 Tax=Bacillales TaxID=1385 RepID=UPI0023785365|nr:MULTISPECIES: tRNA (adenosine(37)-N6)-threonylcarbamoyltransferase complex dimerization subunit type 1 TsaB [Bacillales]MDD9266645.1 tRNA (adenosine(37)-N6)-threonylcarbamoyltransferase complex dimerization subunit type 1 TsaB [Paenibacillus sp. MAHUQ-63]MDR6878767.1 tRNA threonylcarbamoyladenosine biosynthesis protein TsaB [Bacillus sp. 3255]
MTERTKHTGRCLAIDTSSSAMTVALLEDGNLLGEVSSHAERNHSIGLLPHIEELLASRQLKPKDLQAVAAGVGPGSYTGVRIAVSVAKTFAWSLGLTLIGISSLEAMALGGADNRLEVPADGLTWVVPLLDGRRKQAFTAVYAYEGASPLAAEGDPDASWREVLPDGIRVIGPWLAQLRSAAAQAGPGQAPRSILFVGETEGFEAELEQFAQDWPGNCEQLSYGIEAQYIGKLANPRLARGERADVHTLVPNYTRLPEAEANLLAGVQMKKGES